MELAFCFAVSKYNDCAYGKGIGNYDKKWILSQAVAKFMSKVRGGRVQFDADRILMSGGATGANELIMFCLADPGDAFLVPSPYYPAYVSSLLFS